MLERKLDIGPLIERLMLQILRSGALAIRDVDGINGEKEVPYLYSSGWWGPGYVQIKGLVAWESIIKSACILLAYMVAVIAPEINAAAGNVTGGMIPTWEVRRYVATILAKRIPYVYVRDTRKKGGNKEKVTGMKGNQDLPADTEFVVGEELVNFAESIVNSALELRSLGYVVKYGICILYYDNPKANEAVAKAGIKMIYLFTLLELLDVAEKYQTHDLNLINAYRNFLKDPLKWNGDRGLERVEKGGTK